MEVVASLSQGRTAAAQCGLFTYKSVPVIFEPPCTYIVPAGNFDLFKSFSVGILHDKRSNNQSQWPHSLKRGYLAARLLRLKVRIPPETWLFFSCDCYV